MSWSKLRPDIKTLLDSISSINDVKSFPTFDFSGYPAVTIQPSELSSDYETVAENIRIYTFQVRIFYHTADGVPNAINKVEECVDDIIDKLDKEEKFGQTRTIGSSLGAGYTILGIEPVIGPWGYINDGELLVAELSVRVLLSFDIET